MAVFFQATLTLKDGRDLKVQRVGSPVEFIFTQDDQDQSPLDQYALGQLGLDEEGVSFLYEAISYEEVHNWLARAFPKATGLKVVDPPAPSAKSPKF